MSNVKPHPTFYRHRTDEELKATFDPHNRYKKFLVIGVIDDEGRSCTEWNGDWNTAEGLFYLEQLKMELIGDGD